VKQRAFLDATGIGVMEARFYETIGNEVPVRLPRCWHAAVDGKAFVMVPNGPAGVGVARGVTWKVMAGLQRLTLPLLLRPRMYQA
jgi:hypothetical protein